MTVWHELVNGNPGGMRVRVESGDFGVALFDLPLGGRFQISAGILVPRVLIDNVPVEILEGDNVVKIDNHKTPDS